MNLAACRSALLRNRIVMRFGCCLVAVSMIMSCWATPKAKAVATETALLGSIFGSLLVSMGYSWAAENMDMPSFGEAIYKEMKEFDEALKNDSGLSFLADLNLTLLTPLGAGKIGFPVQWVRAANSFAEWFFAKYFSVGTSSAVVSQSSTSITTIGGHTFNLTLFDSLGKDGLKDNFISLGTPILFFLGVDVTTLTKRGIDLPLTDNVVFNIYSDGSLVYCSYFIGGDISTRSDIMSLSVSNLSLGADFMFLSQGDSTLRTCIYYSSDYPSSYYCNKCQCSVSKYLIPLEVLSLTDIGLVESASLTAEKPQEVHYPDVAEDGSQVYEITVDGVTATGIEGIIQGAVDQILAGTAVIAGEVAQAQDVPVDPEAPPELDGLDLPALGAALTSRFPFSIPWDIARGITLLAAPAEAPYWEVDFLAPLGYRVGGWKGSTMVVLDFSQFEVIGQVTRWMSTIGFCLMLASSTKRLIWVA